MASVYAESRRATSHNLIIFQLETGLEVPQAKDSGVLRGWAIEPSPPAHPYPFWLWNLPHAYWLGAFHRAEAERAIEVLGDAAQNATHGVASMVLDHHWCFVTTGKPPKPKPPKRKMTAADRQSQGVAS